MYRARRVSISPTGTMCAVRWTSAVHNRTTSRMWITDSRCTRGTCYACCVWTSRARHNALCFRVSIPSAVTALARRTSKQRVPRIARESGEGPFLASFETALWIRVLHRAIRQRCVGTRQNNTFRHRVFAIDPSTLNASVSRTPRQRVSGVAAERGN